MALARTVLSASLLLLAAASVAPAATASLDNVWVCVGHKEGTCDGNAVIVNVKGERVDACVIGVQGSCDPYQGDLVRAHVNDDEYSVPDPCYTTACF